MPDLRPDPRRPIDPAINSPGREGLTGTAPASLYAPGLEREQITIAPDFAPADAIKRTGDGVVQSARKPRCIACGNCVMACPFGVPEVYADRQLMMKCDMCYDRSSAGKKPMCATVCPSQALFFGTHEEVAALRPQSRPTNAFRFGEQTITTRTYVMVPRGPAPMPLLDVTAAMAEEPQRRNVRLPMHGSAFDVADPFAEVEV